MYEILIVEDEPEAAAQLEGAIERYGAACGEEFHTTWNQSALCLVDERTEPVDLIFLDIDLPGIDGMKAAAEFRERDQSTPIIFVTNLAQYAVKGYAVDALDFIVKPITYGAFALRMDRALQVMRRAAGRTITVKSREGLRAFPANNLVSIEVRGHDLVYTLASGEAIAVRGSLKNVEPELGGSPFLRISSSCIINMAHVRGLRDAQVTLTGGAEVWISRANKRRCLEEITRYLGGGA